MQSGLKIVASVLFAGFATFCSAQKLSKISLTVPEVSGGVGTTGTVELQAKAGATGTVVTLSSSNPIVTVPATVTVAAGQTTATFPVSSLATAANVLAVVKATANGSTESTTLKVDAPQVAEFTFIPTSVQGGSGSTGTVKLTSAAPAGGIKIHFASSTAAWGGPESIVVPAAGTAASFSFTTVPVGAKSDATVNAFASVAHIPAILTLTPPILTGFSLLPASVPGGTDSVGTLKLNGPAPREGVRITLTSDSSAAKVPESVTIPVGQSTATFTIATKSVSEQSSVRILARAPASSIELALTIGLPRIESFAISSSSVTGGTPANGIITLSGPAPAGGVIVALSSSHISVIVPATITIPAGSSSLTFALTTSPVTANQTVVVTATCGLSKPQSASVYVVKVGATKTPPPATPK